MFQIYIYTLFALDLSIHIAKTINYFEITKQREREEKKSKRKFKKNYNFALRFFFIFVFDDVDELNINFCEMLQILR